MMVNFNKMRMMIRKTIKVYWRIKQEEAKATKSTTAITGMPRGGKQKDIVGDGAVKIAELKSAYREVMNELDTMRKELDVLIGTLDNADERAVMRLRYIDGHSPEDIADAISRTDRSVYYYINRAEAKLAKMYPDKVAIK